MVYSDQSQVNTELYWADGFLMGTPTIIGEALKPIWDLTTEMFARTHGGKIASAFGSYGWSGEGVPHIIERLKQLNLKVFREGYKTRFKASEAQFQGAYEFGYNFGKSVLAGKIVETDLEEPTRKTWKCQVCGELVHGLTPPNQCPVCGVGPEQFLVLEEDYTGFKSVLREAIIIIGNGAAGTAACEAIRSRNKVCSIEMISEEATLGYNRPMLTKGLLSNFESLNFFIKPQAWFTENGIKTTLGISVKEIKPEAKELVLSNGEIRSYDKLILATGARSSVPPTKGGDLNGVFSIRSVADVKEIQEYLPGVNKVVLLGGGVLGLEAAWELKRAKKDVSIVERGNKSMSKQLDDKGSSILEEAIKKSDVHLLQNTTVDSLIGSEADGQAGKVTGVKLGDGSVIEADMVIFSMGIKANIGLAKDKGIESTTSILVNEKMETSMKDIYACGDCAIFNGVNYGIWSQAIAMGKVAGANVVGDAETYKQITPLNSFIGMGTSLFAVGDNGKDPDKKYKTFELFDQRLNTYEKMYFENDRFCGGILIGDVKKAVKFSKAYESQESLQKMLSF
jgi:NAD(P)H-nitrite reductase large subunit